MQPQILATDVHYNDEAQTAVAAGVLFGAWTDDKPARTLTSEVPGIAPYVPGRFFERELPCLLQLLLTHSLEPDIIVVDGFVQLDAEGRPGLGAHLHNALGGRCPVIGVAKTSFAGMNPECAQHRGASSRPLYVTAVGLELATAKAYVASMHGKHRIPTLLTAVDHACRGWP